MLTRALLEVAEYSAELEAQRQRHATRQRRVLADAQGVECAHCGYCYVRPAEGESECPLCHTLNASAPLPPRGYALLIAGSLAVAAAFPLLGLAVGARMSPFLTLGVLGGAFTLAFGWESRRQASSR
ncbi:MAG: hypothetical protein R3F62_07045 [Planctomycetota bacterium]